jgi:competence ComEA-like helix-hairpin-helix protein
VSLPKYVSLSSYQLNELPRVLPQQKVPHLGQTHPISAMQVCVLPHNPQQNQPVSSANKISLNQASVDQLQQLQGVGLKKAQAIVAYRQKQGPFKTIDELQQVRGIGPAIFAKNKTRLGL